MDGPGRAVTWTHRPCMPASTPTEFSMQCDADTNCKSRPAAIHRQPPFLHRSALRWCAIWTREAPKFTSGVIAMSSAESSPIGWLVAVRRHVCANVCAFVIIIRFCAYSYVYCKSQSQFHHVLGFCQLFVIVNCRVFSFKLSWITQHQWNGFCNQPYQLRGKA